MKSFVVELDDHLEVLNRELIVMEQADEAEPRLAALRQFYRSAHTLKSAARAVELGAVEMVAHHLESQVSSLLDERLPLTPSVLSLLFQAVDCLAQVAEQLRSSRTLADGPLLALLPKFTALQQAPGADGAAVGSSHKSAGVSPELCAKTGKVPGGPSSPPAAEPVSALSSVGERTLGVRVAAEKLDPLLVRGGEVQQLQRHLEDSAYDANQLKNQVAAWEKRWRAYSDLLEGLVAEALVNVEEPFSRKRYQKVHRWLRQGGQQLALIIPQLEHLSGGLDLFQQHAAQLATGLEEDLRLLRLLPFGEVCSGLERTARDLAQQEGKQVRVDVVGADLELERPVLEKIRGPLLHLVRNAVVHGIERPDQRLAQGKSVEGRLTIRVALERASVRVEVSDDGCGACEKTLLAQARQQGLHLPDPESALSVLFLPGFSTASQISLVAGRGMGLDIVKAAVEALRGVVTVQAEPGIGFSATMTLPLTLSSFSALLVRVGGHLYALPDSFVEAAIYVAPGEVACIEGREMVRRPEGLIPLRALAGLLTAGQIEQAKAGEKLPAVILRIDNRVAAFVVDQFVSQELVTIKTLGPRVARAPFVTGAVQRRDGSVGLVLNANDLLRHVGSGQVGNVRTWAAPASIPVVPVLLLVEDSLTTRNLERMVLEAAGYRVLTAVDGLEAWELLQTKAVDLIISDVEMPRMSGFELTEKLRAHQTLRALPVILVTGLESDRDRARGLEVGANAYLAKRAFDQKVLLETVEMLL